MTKNKYLKRINNLGFKNFFKYLIHKKTNYPKKGEFILKSKFAAHPLICRGGSSDIDVFKHIYTLHEYECFDGIEDPALIIDCGANAGFSTSYFLTRFQKAQVIAVEPDLENFKMLSKNIAAYGLRGKAIQAGIWSKTCGLRFSEIPFGDGREWARSVCETKKDEASVVDAIDIGSLLEESGFDRISLLKIDIEGSELAVFSENYSSWLDKVDHLVIELHGDACTRTYHNAVDQFGFVSQTTEGLTISHHPKSTLR
jgi:FkbM family methyltransferase